MKQFRKNEQDLFICEECGKIFKIKTSLSYHVNKHHYGQKNYYDKWIKEENEDKCKICGIITNFDSIKHGGYKRYCSNKCRAINIKNNTTYVTVLKRKQTCFIKHGDKNYNNMEKSKQTCLKHFGVEYSLQSKEIKEKRKQTCLKKYDVENPAQNKNIFEKTQKTGLMAKNFKNTNIYYRGKFELDFLEKYYDKYPDMQNGPTIKYKFKEKDKVYFPDFIIPSLNLIIEIKCSYYANRDKLQLIEKEKSTIINGYNYIIIIDKDYLNFNKLFA